MDTVNYYRELLAKYGPTYQAVDAGSEFTHWLRLKVLLEIVECDHQSILDVGCGMGDLTALLPPVKTYMGFDILPEMIEAAKVKYPGRRFEVRDIAEETADGVADYVLASGLFQFSPHREMAQTLEILYRLCLKGVAVNFLRDKHLPGNECQMPPEIALCLADRLTPYFTLRCDYLPNDFTLYLYKEKQS